MNEFLIGLSVYVFFLLPYYLTLLTADKRLYHCHIFLWLGLHLGFTIALSIRGHSPWNTPLVLFCASLLYFGCTYFFFLRKVDTQEGLEVLRALLNRRSTHLFLYLLLGISGLLVFADAQALGAAKDAALPTEAIGFYYLAGSVVLALIENSILVGVLLKKTESGR